MNIRHTRRKWYHTFCIALAAIVVFCTVYALILPAITLENTSYEDESASGGEYYEENGIMTLSANSVSGYSLSVSTDISFYYCTYSPGGKGADGTGTVCDYIRNYIAKADATQKDDILVNSAGTATFIPVRYFEEYFAPYGYTFNENDTAVCPVNYRASSGYGSMSTTSYVNIDGARYIKVNTVNAAMSLYYTYLEVATDTLNPSSTVISMFDYYTSNDRSVDDNHVITSAEYELGINKGHTIKFGKNMGRTKGLINYSWGGTTTPSKVTQGIVQNTLGEDGYPRLNGDSAAGQAIDIPAGDTESLAYLFNPYIDVEGRAAFPRVTGLLYQNDMGYFCYDSTKRAVELDETTNVITEYTTPGAYYDVNNTTHINGQFFPFNDAHQSSLLTSITPPMNHYFGLTMTARFIQDYDGHTNSRKNVDMVFNFSGDNDVWIFIDNVLVGDLGGLRSAAKISINFATGAVTIDDKGITGNATGTPNTTIRAAFEAAGEGSAWEWNGDTFPDGSIHTLKFYYMERGNYDSNISLEYNLNQIPPSGISKVDQYGEPLSGAKFAVYKADESYNYISSNGVTSYTSEQAKSFTIDENDGSMYDAGGNLVIDSVYCGVTQNGEMIFVDADGMPYSMNELKTIFGEHFILREIYIPDGYRTVSDEIYVHIDGGVMICDNTYDSGVWARNNVMVTATNTLYVAREYSDAVEAYPELNEELKTGVTETVGGEEKNIYYIDYYAPETNTKNGTLFSVVLKRNTRDFWHGFGYDYWFPVYGSDATGYTVVDEGVPDEPADWSNINFYTADVNINAVIAAAQAQKSLLGEDALVFKESGGGMQLTMNHLPGKINRYYSWLLANGKLEECRDSDTDPQYVVAYYWTAADSLDGATAENTVRVYSHENMVSDVNGMTLQWGTTISVPNMENRLFMQKLDEEGNLVDGAVFAMYEVGEDSEGRAYYFANGDETHRVYLDCKITNGEIVKCESDAELEEMNAVICTVDAYGNITDMKTGSYRISAGAENIAVGAHGSVTATDGNGSDATAALGVITVTADSGEKYTVSPAANADGDIFINATHEACDVVNEGGTAHFMKISTSTRDSPGNGTYVVREIAAPNGFIINRTQTRVLVNDNGVYANAGKADNGVSVGNGVGYLSETLEAFGSIGEIDETLSWMYIALLVNSNESFRAFEAVSGDVLILNDEMIQNGWSFAAKQEGDPQAHASGNAYTRSQAMVSYLIYSEEYDDKSDSVFNYASNPDQSARTRDGLDVSSSIYETLAGEGGIRLYTAYGWSDAAIYQDYLYGIRQNEIGTVVNYDDLTAKGNISNLFSSSTWIQYVDKNLIDLDVLKISASGADSANKTVLSGASFVLWREIADSETGEKENYYYSYDNETGKTLWLPESEMIGSVYSETLTGGDDYVPDYLTNLALTTGDDGMVRFRNLYDGVYYLKEIKAPANYEITAQTVEITVKNGVASANASSTVSGVKVIGDLNTGQTLEVPNRSAFILPSTGGEGTLIYTIAGALIIEASLVGGYALWCEHDERRSKDI